MNAAASTFAPITTPRLILRAWLDDDRAPFAEMNADPRVMAFFPTILDRKASDAVMDTLKAHFAAYGFGLCALELRGAGEFVGFTGLKRISFDAPFAPEVEIGWRLMHPFWGRGLASEAARAAMEYGFKILRLPEIVAITPVRNLRSRRVMERIGMTHDPQDDFAHPKLPAESDLQPCALYRIRRNDYFDMQMQSNKDSAHERAR